MIALTLIIFIAKSSISFELGADHLEILQVAIVLQRFLFIRVRRSEV